MSLPDLCVCRLRVREYQWERETRCYPDHMNRRPSHDPLAMWLTRLACSRKPVLIRVFQKAPRTGSVSSSSWGILRRPQAGDLIPPKRLLRGFLPVGRAGESFKGRFPGGLPIRPPPPQLAPFNGKEQGLRSELPPEVRAFIQHTFIR